MPRRGENIYKRKDGRWEGRYPNGIDDVTGRQRWRSVYGRSYQECRQRLAQAKECPVPPQRLHAEHKDTFGCLLEDWLKENEPRLRPSSQAIYRNLIYRHIIPALGEIKIKAITSQKIEAFLLSKSQDHEEGGILSESTIRLLRIVINSVLGAAYQNGFIPIQIRPKMPYIAPEQHQKADVYRVWEQRKLERTAALCCEKNNAYYAILVSLRTGLRVGELCALRFGDINWEDGTLSVRATLQRVPNPLGVTPRTRLIIGPPKSRNSCRVIPIVPEVLQILRRCWESHPVEERGKACFIFGKGSAPVEPRTLERLLQRSAAEAQVPTLKFHALRHTFATRCMEAGMDGKSLSEILGHSSMEITTGVYVHSLMEQKRYGLERLVQYLQS